MSPRPELPANPKFLAKVKGYNIIEIPLDIATDVEQEFFKTINDARSIYNCRNGMVGKVEDTSVAVYSQKLMNSYFKQFIGNDRLLREDIFDHFMTYETTDSGSDCMAQVSALQYGTFVDYTGPNLEVRGGFQNVVESLLKESMATVVLNCAVDNITLGSEQSERPLNTVYTEHGSIYSAKYVIFTGSLNYLKHNKDSLFTPHLPERKTHAISKIGKNEIFYMKVLCQIF